jgi:hypothetical protein
MPDSYDLTKLDEASFEHLVNALALRVLGAGHTGFGPGPDGGRDGYFEGVAPYPSSNAPWSGRWYLQSKFHRPHLSKDPQKWLIGKIQEELTLFQSPDSKRTWPNNWIIATNIDPSGSAETGAFDRANKIVSAAYPQLESHFHIWGGRKLLQLLAQYPDIAEYYAHFLTPGNVLTSLYNQLHDAQASITSIVRYFIVTQFTEQQYTKLEQAGSNADSRPGIHRLFTDLPFTSRSAEIVSMSAAHLARTAARSHRIDQKFAETAAWQNWNRHPSRARIWFIKGGPGQGKSTLTQYMSQIQRAALILGANAPQTTPLQYETAKEIQEAAIHSSLWPVAPRIPVYVELKEFAKWYGGKSDQQPRGILTYLAERLTQQIEQPAHTGTLKRAFSSARWMFVFDGLDEVPGDVKSSVAAEIISFVDDALIGLSSDALTICTSRPQGYSGQFAKLNAAEVELIALNPQQALNCAIPVLLFDRPPEESKQSVDTLKEALQSAPVREIMTTPLQSHIMAVVVRDGGRPPDRKWRLYTNFYQVIKKREANRNLADKKISKFLHSGDKLIKALHNRLGFELHARAEQSNGAQTSILRGDLVAIIRQIVTDLQTSNIDEIVDTLSEATTERLVLVNTPESKEYVRFDIRPLQEFFAAEFMYEDTDAIRIGNRLTIVGGDSHWREVMHFLLSALVENARQTDLAVAVDRLSNLNERSDASPARVFYRRLAPGGIIAARLLAEGVLDQDQRVRQQFKRCIEPLFGSTEIVSGRMLSSVRGSDSASWLIGVMADNLREQAESESIGAAYVLCNLLDDDDVRRDEIERCLQSKSIEYKACLFYMLRGESEPWGPQPQPTKVGVWVSRLVLNCLRSDEWRGLGERGIAGSFAVLSTQLERLTHIALSIGLDKELAEFIPRFIPKHDRSNSPVTRVKEHTEVWNGLLRVSYCPPEDALNPSKWSENLRRSVESAPGFFAIISHIYSLASGSASQATIAELNRAGDILSVLPEELRCFLPEQFDVFASRGASRPTDKTEMSWAYKPGYVATFEFVGDRAGQDYGGLLQDHPDLALALHAVPFGGSEQQPFSEFVLQKDGARRVAEAFMKRPHIFAHEPAAWGKFLKICNESDGIRGALLDAAKLWKPHFAFGEVEPFIIELPQEAAFLPPLFHAVACDDDQVRFLHRRQIPKSELIGQFFPSADALLKVLHSEKCLPSEKGAAAMFYLLHPNCVPAKCEEAVSAVVENYEPGMHTWYLRCAGRALWPRIINENDAAIEAMATLLRAGNSDFAGRFELSKDFESWRQRSSAPVTHHGIQFF